MKNTLKIGFDAKRLFLNTSGLGNYSRWLVKGLSDNFPQNEYHLYSPVLSDYIKDFIKDGVYFHEPVGIIKKFWRIKTVKKDLIKHNIEIFHGLSNEIPYGIEKSGIKTVVTIHDLIFKTHPEFYNPVDVLIYDNKFKSACNRADKIVAISNYTKNLITELYKINPEKIETIYLDSPQIYHTIPHKQDIENIKNKYSIFKPFLLNVGAIGGRKNQFRILEAYRLIADKTDLNIVFAGKNSKNSELLSENIKKYNLDERCKIIKEISDDDLHKLYHASYATIYPSIIEGFGIPILESYRSGKPVITSLGTSLEEIAGKAALLCNPLESESIAQSILKIAESETYQKLSENIEAELARFTPENTINRYMKLYEGLMK